MKNLFRFLGLACLMGYLFTGLYVAAEEKNPTTAKQPSDAPVTTPKAQVYLGLAVSSLPAALTSQLPDTLGEGRGVLVIEVSPDSPAAKAGIKAHDVLVNYDEQKLFSPEQLIKLVRGDKPGREVTISLIRKGEAESVKVKLGERTAATEPPSETAAQQKSSRFPSSWLRGSGQRGKASSEASAPSWNSFDSMTLKKLDKDRFHASIKHTDKQGKLQTHEFEGTRDEIRKKVEADEDLTPEERTHLLRSLNLGDPGIPLWIFPDESDLDF